MQNALVEAFALNNANYNHKNTVFLQIIKALSSKSFFHTFLHRKNVEKLQESASF